MIVLGMVLIQSQVLSSSAASVTFSAIPQTYKSLRLVVSARTDRAGNQADIIQVKPNDDTANGSLRYLEGNGSAASSATSSSLNRVLVSTAATAAANTFGNGEALFPNYTSAAAKTISADTVSEDNATVAFADLVAGLWNSTASITSLVLVSGTASNFVAGSSFYLYGIS